MAKIKLHKSARIIESTEGETLMETLLNAGVPVASSCGGEGVCTKCKIKVISQPESLSSPTDIEKNGLSKFQREERNFRLSCQAYVLGNVEVDADYR